MEFLRTQGRKIVNESGEEVICGRWQQALCRPEKIRQ